MWPWQALAAVGFTALSVRAAAEWALEGGGDELEHWSGSVIGGFAGGE